MDRQYIHDEQIVERYLQRKLSPAEEQAFEEAYLGDPDLFAELKAAERLRDELKDVDDADLPARAPPRSWWLELATSPRLAIAASVVAVAALSASGLLLLQNRAGESAAPSSLAAASRVRVLPLVSVRGAAEANVINAPNPDDLTVLLLDPGFGDYDDYRAVLVRVDRSAEREILRLDGIQRTYEDQLALGVPGRMLVPGEYEVRLAGGRRAGGSFDELGRTRLTVAPRP